MTELERKLEALRGPKMPPEVEARVRARLLAEVSRPPLPKSRRLVRTPGPRFWLMIFLLSAATGLIGHSVVPYFQHQWAMNHCAPLPAGRPDAGPSRPPAR